MNQIVPALIGAASALLVTLVAAWVGYRRYLHERAHDQETLLNALFGEAKELRLRLQWSMYGGLQSTQQVSRYGFLNAADIRLLLQLGLRIRNSDRFLELLLADLSAVKRHDLSSATVRMRYVINTTHQLIHRLVSKRPRLQKILLEIENDLPSIQKLAG